MFKIHPGQFEVAPPNAKDIFKACVNAVHIEVSSYCNRVCSFCPNATYDRRSKTFMSDDVFFRVLDDLRSIDYSETICLWRYNEMLSDREYIIKRIKKCKEYIPKSNIFVTTNGDYLNKDYLFELIDAGIGSMMIDIYLQEDAEYTTLSMLNAMSKRLNSLGIPYEFTHIDRNTIRAFAHPTKNFKIEVVSRNLHEIGHGRLGQIKGAKNYQRTSPCHSVFSFFEVEHNGTVVPCCNIRSDISDHKDYLVGKIDSEHGVFDIYFNNIMTGWRRDLLPFGEKKSPCDICYDRLIPDTPENVSQFNGVAMKLGLIQAE